MRPYRIRWRVAPVLAALVAALLSIPMSTASATQPGPNTSTAGRAPAARFICYRAHVQNIAWQGWVCNGEMAGTVGRSLRMEALQLRAFEVGQLCAQAHVQNIGWQDERCAGESDLVSVGTTGRSLRMEALRLRISTGQICANAYLHNIGWQGLRCGQRIEVGTTGQSRAMEAITIYGRES